jgi:hypothetical protein
MYINMYIHIQICIYIYTGVEDTLLNFDINRYIDICINICVCKYKYVHLYTYIYLTQYIRGQNYHINL